MTQATTRPATLGELDPSQNAPLGVRDEIRRNLIERLRAGTTPTDLFPGIVGYGETVVPQLINALLSRHDIILLGLRGQAKTRLCRQLTALLDEVVPVVPGCPLRSHPLNPQSQFAREQIAAEGSDLVIEWLPRDRRYNEKLATPDVSMADLIGDLDPLKAAHEKLDLSDERVINYGIIPRSNRGLFTVNELPDLAPRIQVGLLNILEEQDVQIRGFPIRIDLDVLLLFTANPEDYTNRGSIITPLKDRIASQILTHYPETLEDADLITSSEAWTDRGELEISIPPFVASIVEMIAFQGRRSEYVDQNSGVSARLSIAARELLVSQVERRAVTLPDTSPVARVIDITQVVPAITGKLELVYEGEQEGTIQIARRLVTQATQEVFDQHFPDVISEGREGSDDADRYKPTLDWFASGNRLELGDDMNDADYRAALDAVPGLGTLVDEFLPSESPLHRAAAMELILDGLHAHSMLAKEDAIRGCAYTDMLGIMMEGLR